MKSHQIISPINSQNIYYFSHRTIKKIPNENEIKRASILTRSISIPLFLQICKSSQLYKYAFTASSSNFQIQNNTNISLIYFIVCHSNSDEFRSCFIQQQQKKPTHTNSIVRIDKLWYRTIRRIVTTCIQKIEIPL